MCVGWLTDALRRDVRANGGGPHHHRDALLGLGLGQAVRVVRAAVAEHLGVDVRAAGDRVPTSTAPLRPRRSRSRRVLLRRTAVRRETGTRPRLRGRASAVKPARMSGSMHDSVPPAITASASPRLITADASPSRATRSRRPRRSRSSASARAISRSGPMPCQDVVRQEAPAKRCRAAVAQGRDLLGDPGPPPDRRAEEHGDPRRVEIGQAESASASFATGTMGRGRSRACASFGDATVGRSP